VKEELRAIHAAGVREVAFLDTNFNMDRKRAVELWRFLKDLGGRVRYAFELRGELIDAEQAEALSALDYFAEIGLQSINEASLKAVKRWYEPDRFFRGVRLLLDAGIYRECTASGHGGVAVDLMMALPRETVEDAMAGLDFVFALGSPTVVLAMTKILPGTELHDDARRFRYESDPDAQYEVRSSSTLTKEEVRDLGRFRDAVDFAYNRIHAVRTVAWVAAETGTAPSAVFMEMGRRIAAGGRPASSLGLADLQALLEGICRDRGKPAAAEGVAGRLSAENLLNVLQRNREARRSWWRDAAFRAGHWLLRRLSPLPPAPAPVPPVRSGVEPVPAPAI
jgi:hypothetical protein